MNIVNLVISFCDHCVILCNICAKCLGFFFFSFLQLFNAISQNALAFSFLFFFFSFFGQVCRIVLWFRLNLHSTSPPFWRSRPRTTVTSCPLLDFLEVSGTLKDTWYFLFSMTTSEYGIQNAFLIIFDRLHTRFEHVTPLNHCSLSCWHLHQLFLFLTCKMISFA